MLITDELQMPTVPYFGYWCTKVGKKNSPKDFELISLLTSQSRDKNGDFKDLERLL
jgi:hypothetical protein